MAQVAKSASSPAVKEASRRVEEMLAGSPAYRKVEEALYCLKQGSTLLMISVHPWHDRAVVRLAAQLVKGVTMEVPLALELLETNALLRFGAFAFVPAGEVVVYSHTLLDRDLSDREEFLAMIRDFVLIADDYDDRIAARYGGQTMAEILEENVVEQMRKRERPGTAEKPEAPKNV